MPKKRNYLHCFICWSDCLWSGKKQKFCLECKDAANPCPRPDHRYCPSDRCHHKGKKDYFSICYSCYEKVPLKDNKVDWNWIIEMQNSLENEHSQKQKVLENNEF